MVSTAVVAPSSQARLDSADSRDPLDVASSLISGSKNGDLALTRANSNTYANAMPPAIVIQDHTLMDNPLPVTMDRTPIAYQSGFVRVGSSTYAIPVITSLDQTYFIPLVEGSYSFSPVMTLAAAPTT